MSVFWSLHLMMSTASTYVWVNILHHVLICMHLTPHKNNLQHYQPIAEWLIISGSSLWLLEGFDNLADPCLWFSVSIPANSSSRNKARKQAWVATLSRIDTAVFSWPWATMPSLTPRPESCSCASVVGATANYCSWTAGANCTSPTSPPQPTTSGLYYSLCCSTQKFSLPLYFSLLPVPHSCTHLS